MKMAFVFLLGIQTITILTCMVLMMAAMGGSKKLEIAGERACVVYMVCWALFAAEALSALFYYVIIPWGME